MSRTLFWYIFRDLLRIFFLASGVLSAIMSFGGLLKPLYEFGLGVSQVGKILGWSGPAMTAYSLPIAALFATTIVYGRLGADNEITACRAAGISHLWMSFPAFVLGLVTAFVSLALLCFVVPACTLKVEKIVYSNLAQIVAGQIERTHQISSRMGNSSKPMTVFAQAANILPTDASRPGDQALQLVGPVIVTYEPAEKNKPLVPKHFFLAREAIVSLRQDHEDDDVMMRADLFGGTRFPRSVVGPARQSARVSLGTSSFAELPLASPLRENTKFMDIFRLRDLLDHPEHSRNISSLLRDFIRRDQEQDFLGQLVKELNGPTGAVLLDGESESYKVIRGAVPAEIRKDQLVIPGSAASPAKLVQIKGRTGLIHALAMEIIITARPESDTKQITVEIEMADCELDVAGEKTPHQSLTRDVVVPMPSPVFSLTTRPASVYVSGSLPASDKQKLRQNIIKQTNSAISEIYSRLSFAVSCFILVMVGCALGMMFKSGNFLSAFAISVIPALMSIALIVTGQHTCENVPNVVPQNWSNPLALGLMLIWSGNVAVFAIAVVLLGRLQRQ